MEPTKAELEAIPSIYTKWRKQLFGEWSDGKGGFCALGFRSDKARLSVMRRAAFDQRIAAYIRMHYPMPPDGTRDEWGNTFFIRSDAAAIIYANNVLRLTPDDFRHIDRLTQWQAMQKQIDAIPEPIAELEGTK